MNQLRFLVQPIMIFIFSIVTVAVSLILYIYWYVEISSGLRAVISKSNLDPGQVLAPQTWVVILILSILVGIILMGIFTIFVYNQKTLQLYRLQRSFINNFTHELKTPVTSLKLYLETFRKHRLSREDQLKYVDYMIRDADRLSETINHILNLARIESKTYKKNFVTTELVGFTEQFCERNKHIFHGSEIHVHNTTGRLFEYKIDIALFEMLLMNLLTNAIKYNSSKIPRVDISFEPRDGELHIRFEDNGIGLPRSEIKKIFRKFYQIGRPDNLSAGGSGIGLYLVDTIARIHKGKARAESREEGSGSVFTIILPLKPIKPAAAPQGDNS
ncbi:MAG: HAMP domain-containing histidine kinase [Deltaproteobacteria bacterium]|nr:HAMP domain-containing histidine kinase [Deltaproteobacteria bacterium]MBW1962239.1 HAMP domain-containing histidine kinase [Deltaproteobacteria bacterium]MBW1995128.1 HAMP domain-containing histidine kinase [Deltaproteobacteria bacterium]MBW2153722.1 HAMP domain-containing histidine kinase [Deltaproteobacteria bacterium]